MEQGPRETSSRRWLLKGEFHKLEPGDMILKKNELLNSLYIANSIVSTQIISHGFLVHYPLLKI